MYNIELHYLTIKKHTFKLYTFLIFISIIIFLILQRDLEQSFTVLELLFTKRYLEWARSLCLFVVIRGVLKVFQNNFRSMT